MRKYIFYLFLYISISCAQERDIEVTREDFTLSYPPNFIFDESGQEGAVFILKTEQEGEDDSFIENLNLVTKNAENISFEDFTLKTKKEIGSVAQIEKSERLEIGGNKCLRLNFQLSQNGVLLKFIQHYYIWKGKVYILTFSSENNAYSKYYDSMNNILMSFRLK